MTRHRPRYSETHRKKHAMRPGRHKHHKRRRQGIFHTLHRNQQFNGGSQFCGLFVFAGSTYLEDTAYAASGVTASLINNIDQQVAASTGPQYSITDYSQQIDSNTDVYQVWDLYSMIASRSKGIGFQSTNTSNQQAIFQGGKAYFTPAQFATDPAGTSTFYLTDFEVRKAALYDATTPAGIGCNAVTTYSTIKRQYVGPNSTTPFAISNEHHRVTVHPFTCTLELAVQKTQQSFVRIIAWYDSDLTGYQNATVGYLQKEGQWSGVSDTKYIGGLNAGFNVRPAVGSINIPATELLDYGDAKQINMIDDNDNNLAEVGLPLWLTQRMGKEKNVVYDKILTYDAKVYNSASGTTPLTQMYTHTFKVGKKRREYWSELTPRDVHHFKHSKCRNPTMDSQQFRNNFVPTTAGMRLTTSYWDAPITSVVPLTQQKYYLSPVNGLWENSPENIGTNLMAPSHRSTLKLAVLSWSIGQITGGSGTTKTWVPIQYKLFVKHDFSVA